MNAHGRLSRISAFNVHFCVVYVELYIKNEGQIAKHKNKPSVSVLVQVADEGTCSEAIRSANAGRPEAEAGAVTVLR